MTRRSYQQGRIYIGRLPQGADVVAAITRIANEEGIKVGTVAVYGMLSRLALSVAGQPGGMAQVVEREECMEIASLGGTLSQFKGRSMARLNGAFAGGDGSLVGGSLALGSIVYACEVVITELVGGVLTRDFDAATGLPLWKENSLLLGE